MSDQEEERAVALKQTNKVVGSPPLTLQGLPLRHTELHGDDWFTVETSIKDVERLKNE